ncbi:tetratricopeptide repeat protein [Chryseobacterium zhengzhouense]|uniref:Tetratricopeptide repeat protein n=1 Tax=Chryseobacterium zhengzhouense TaxID=1636086 RepID=A0ABW2LYF6_9FLAO
MKNILIFLFFLTLVSCEGQNNKHQSSTEIKKKDKTSSKELQCDEITFYNPEKKLWKNFRTKDKDFKKINAENNLYFIEGCKSLTKSPDNKVFLMREVINDQFQDNYDYYEAPYVAIDTHTQDYASYVGIVDENIQFLSLSNAKADFINAHDFIFEDNIYYLSDELLKRIPKLIKNNNLNFSLDDIKEYLNNEPLTEQNIAQYNDIAYYLNEKNKYEESLFLLKIITDKFPNRTVAYLNLGDSYWNIYNKEKAKKSYTTYIELMKSQKKDLSKIPQRVYDRIK